MMINYSRPVVGCDNKLGRAHVKPSRVDSTRQRGYGMPSANTAPLEAVCGQPAAWERRSWHSLAAVEHGPVPDHWGGNGGHSSKGYGECWGGRIPGIGELPAWVSNCELPRQTQSTSKNLPFLRSWEPGPERMTDSPIDVSLCMQVMWSKVRNGTQADESSLFRPSTELCRPWTPYRGIKLRSQDVIHQQSTHSTTEWTSYFRPHQEKLREAAQLPEPAKRSLS
ncbi:hypothetical protein N657DRAFT_449721 [Parathielavia appendiculata]|uniref:Uncharacterized protein n=1 Tax=Parathielavia appendiculata TaxID=2587402 RepID=A0AAN6Z371_9PEZI|nr:hypothetical protein N657DRAFT_449721 [Parathielavia appendiculata]